MQPITSLWGILCHCDLVTKGYQVFICYNTGIIVTAEVIIVGYVWCRCDLTAVWWVPDHLSWLRLFLMGCILYAINNCVNESVIFRVNFISGDWSSCIGGFPFLATPFIYRLFSGWVFIIHCWVSQMIRDHSSFPYHLVGLFMSTPVSLLFLFPLPWPPWPPLTRPTLPSNCLPLPPLPPLPSQLTCRLCPCLPDDGWIS